MFDINKYPETTKLYKELIYCATGQHVNSNDTIAAMRLYIKQHSRYKVQISQFDINLSDESICMLLEDHVTFFMDDHLYFRTRKDYHAFIDEFTQAVSTRNAIIRNLYVQ